MAWYKTTPVQRAPKYNVASGTVANFETNVVLPMKSVVANIEPVQDLHGYANPWAGGAGSNKWDEQWELGGFNSVGEPIPADDRIRSVNFTPIQPNTSYYFKTTNTLGVRYYDANKNFISSANGTNTALTTPSNAYYLKLLILNTTTYENDVAVNYPSSVTTYSPYENICPISGTDELTLNHKGKNLLDNDGYFPLTRSQTSAYYRELSFTNGFLPKVELKEGITYTLSLDIQCDNEPFVFTVGAGDGRYLVDIASVGNQTSGRIHLTFTPTSANLASGAIMAIRCPRYGTPQDFEFTLSSVQLEIASTATTYEPYTGSTYTFDLGQEIMGGSADVVGGVGTKNKYIELTGEETEQWRFIDADHIGLLTIADLYSRNTANNLCNLFAVQSLTGWGQLADKSVGFLVSSTSGLNTIGIKNTDWNSITDMKTFLASNTVQLYYELQTPTDFTFTGQPINSYLGVNNVYVDSGEVLDVEYAYMPVGNSGAYFPAGSV